MKKSLFLVFPLVATGLFSCNGKREISYEDAVKVVAAYKDNINNETRAKDMHITGNINNFNIDGDLLLKGKIGSKSMPKPIVVDIDQKDAKLSIDKQELADTDVPVSLVQSYVAESLMKQSVADIYDIMSIVVAYPLHEKLLPFLGGFEIKNTNKDPTLDDFTYKKWETIDARFYKVGTKLRFEAKTDNAVASAIEFAKRAGGSGDLHYDKNVPAFVTMTFSEIGYIEELAISTETPGKVNIATPTEEDNDFICNINASVSVDVSLQISRTFYIPVTVNYQLVEYKIEIDQEGGYSIVKSGKKDISPNLDDFKDYFTVDWCNYEEPEKDDYSKDPEPIYDDPICKVNYWRDRSQNIAFESDNYDVVIVPKHTYTPATGIWEPNYQILGLDASSNMPDKIASPLKEVEIPNALSSISYNGYLINDTKGGAQSSVEMPYIRSLSNQKLVEKDKDGKDAFVNAPGCANLYIPAKYIKDSNGEYVVSIAVLNLELPKSGNVGE